LVCGFYELSRKISNPVDQNALLKILIKSKMVSERDCGSGKELN